MMPRKGLRAKEAGAFRALRPARPALQVHLLLPYCEPPYQTLSGPGEAHPPLSFLNLANTMHIGSALTLVLHLIF